MKLLVTTDFSELSLGALPFAVEIAAAHPDSSITALLRLVR
jgi:hypothetical protein